MSRIETNRRPSDPYLGLVLDPVARWHDHPAQLAALSSASSQLGSGTLELTPAATCNWRDHPTRQRSSPAHSSQAQHRRSPLSGRVGGNADVRPWVGELDARILRRTPTRRIGRTILVQSRRRLRRWSGLGADVGVHVFEEGCALLLIGRNTGITPGCHDVIKTLVAVALDQPGVELSATPLPARTKPPVGWILRKTPRRAGASVPLGFCRPRRGIPCRIEAPLVLTPWRSVLVCDLDEAWPTLRCACWRRWA